MCSRNLVGLAESLGFWMALDLWWVCSHWTLEMTRSLTWSISAWTSRACRSRFLCHPMICKAMTEVKTNFFPPAIFHDHPWSISESGPSLWSSVSPAATLSTRSGASRSTTKCCQMWSKTSRGQHRMSWMPRFFQPFWFPSSTTLERFMASAFTALKRCKKSWGLELYYWRWAVSFSWRKDTAPVRWLGLRTCVDLLWFATSGCFCCINNLLVISCCLWMHWIRRL